MLALDKSEYVKKRYWLFKGSIITATIKMFEKTLNVVTKTWFCLELGGSER